MKINELKILQNLDIEIKILKSRQRIREWADRYGKNGIYVSFSGGKDSTVLLDLVRSVYPDVPAVFADTGLEYPEIREFVKNTENVEWIKPKISFNKVIEKYGYPVISKEQSQFINEARRSNSQKLIDTRLNGNLYNRGKISKKWLHMLDAPFMVSDKCCEVMKKRPFREYEKLNDKKAIVGTMAVESALRTQRYLKVGCNSFDSKRPVSNPIGFWKEEDIWCYIALMGLSYSEIYDKGYKRTGCMFCMYGCQFKDDKRFELMEKTHPKEFKYCMDKLGLKKVLEFTYGNSKRC